MSKFLFQNGQTVLFMGDSITDCGRRGNEAPFGHGYAKQVIDLITAKYPERRIHFINKGIGGNTVLDLMNRWQDDVVRHRPDWLSILIGINDEHRFLARTPDTVSVERYEEGYRTILTWTRQKLPKTKILLLDPFYISQTKETASFRGKVLELLPQYIAVAHKMVREFKTLHVPMQDVYLRQLKYRETDRFCPEPVHPNPSGHMVMAFEYLRAVGW
ncbi:MAG: SGNH/GDSL hydrolase family protein [Verrucomicrobiae bacterium]|nr:SGNH/GDSL hydrolase family protein [Verrucomicrobiae bacterium]